MRDFGSRASLRPENPPGTFAAVILRIWRLSRVIISKSIVLRHPSEGVSAKGFSPRASYWRASPGRPPPKGVPAEGRPSEGRPSEGRPSGRRPTEGRPSGRRIPGIPPEGASRASHRKAHPGPPEGIPSGSSLRRASLPEHLRPRQATKSHRRAPPPLPGGQEHRLIPPYPPAIT